MLPIEVIIIRWQEFNLSRWLLTYNQTVECDISCIEIFSSFDLVIGGGSSIRQVYGGWRQCRIQIFPTAWATRARRVTHPMPVTLRRLLELKINWNRVLLSAGLCTSIVTLASGSPGQRPGSPGLGSAIGWRHDVAIGLGDYWCYNNRLNFFSGVAMSDSYCCIAFLEGFSLSLFIFFANKKWFHRLLMERLQSQAINCSTLYFSLSTWLNSFSFYWVGVSYFFLMLHTMFDHAVKEVFGCCILYF